MHVGKKNCTLPTRTVDGTGIGRVTEAKVLRVETPWLGCAGRLSVQ